MKRNLSFVGTGISHVLIAALCFLVFGPVLSSCSRDKGPDGGLTGGESTLNVALRAGSFAGTPMDGGEMEEDATKAIPATGMHEDDMANIWVLQFNTTGACVRSRYYAAYDPANFPVTLSNGTAQTVVFVANTFDANLFKDYAGSWSTFQALTKASTAESGLYTGTAADHYLIISGIYKGDITSAGLPAAVQMKRAVAKVKFAWSLSLPTGDVFTAKSLQMCRVPRVQAYLESSASLYPATVVDTITYTAVANPTAGTTTWYVTENLRGTGTGSTSFDKNAATAPGGEGAYCTYINLCGDYTFKDGPTVSLSYKFYLGANTTSDYNVRRNNIYDLTVRITGANAADQRITITSASGTLGLEDKLAAADEPNQDAGFGMAPPANCFIVSPGGSVTFDPRMQGNGGTGAVAIAPKSMGVLWQEGDGVNPLIRNIAFSASQATVYASSKVAGGGNAVVAAYSGENCTGNILWSWQIWVTDYAPDGTKSYGLGADSKAVVGGGQVHTYGALYMAKNPGKVIMDRNLGATKTYYNAPPRATTPAEKDEIGKSFGMFYQWGRKDPFPRVQGASINENDATGTTIPIYAADGKTVLPENGAGFKKVNITTGGVISGTNSLAYAVKNPLAFIYNGTIPFDWYATTAGNQNNALWVDGIKKSVYDPCPSGWRVAPDGTWSNFTRNETTPLSGTFPYYSDGTPVEACGPGNYKASNGRLYKVSTSGTGTPLAWYPAPGYRDYGRAGYEGVLDYVGHGGSVWSSSFNDSNGKYLSFYSTWLNPSNGAYRSMGYQVRCVQE